MFSNQHKRKTFLVLVFKTSLFFLFYSSQLKLQRKNEWWVTFFCIPIHMWRIGWADWGLFLAGRSALFNGLNYWGEVSSLALDEQSSQLWQGDLILLIDRFESKQKGSTWQDCATPQGVFLLDLHFWGPLLRLIHVFNLSLIM
jgi:hypothetical protein